MASNTVNIHKLQNAINMRGHKILYATSQFYSTQQDRPITIYQIKQAVVDEETKSITSYLNRDAELEILKQAKQDGLFDDVELISFSQLLK